MMNVPTPITSPQQLIICKVSSEEGSIILPFMSRSPTFSSKYSENFHTALKRLSDTFPSSLLVIGDFNYPKVQRDYYTSKKHDVHFEFMECIRYSFFKNLVKEPTRERGTNNQSLLDLVLTYNNVFIDLIMLQRSSS